MPKRFTDRPVKVGDILSAEMINSLIVPLDNAINALEGVVIDWQAQIDLFNSLGLKRISIAIQPLLDQINGAINGGLLVADTTDTIGFAQGDDIDLLIVTESRVTFQPTPFVMLTHPSAAADWALCRVTSYVQTTGVISLEVLTLHGSGSSRTGWVVSASAGLADAILNAAVSAGASAAAAAQSAEDAGAAAILIAGGPVSTVNGRAGIVTGLAEAADVYTKTAADLLLAAKADVDVVNALRSYATVSSDADFTLTVGTSAEFIRHTGTLTTNRAVTLATAGASAGSKFKISRTGSGAYNLNIGTGPLATLRQNTWAEFEYDGSAWFLAAHGVTNTSSFAETLLDDADASTARATLGITSTLSIIQTQTISSPVASIVFTGIPSTGYSKFFLVIENLATVKVTTIENAILDVSTDGGSTWKTTSGNYYNGTSALPYFSITNLCSGASSTFKYGNHCIELYGLGNANRATSVSVVCGFTGASTTSIYVVSPSALGTRAAAEADTAIRLRVSTGENFSAGTLILYGVAE